MASTLERLGRGLRWAFFGRPARGEIGRLRRARRLYVAATITEPESAVDLRGQPVCWVKVQLLEIETSSAFSRGGGLRALVTRVGAPGPDVAYRVVGEIVRGTDLAVETSAAEPLVLRAGTFDLAPTVSRPPVRLGVLPAELGGRWPGAPEARWFVRETRLRRGDEIHFEALFVPERHPRPGEGYRGDADVRYRVEPEEEPIALHLPGRSTRDRA